MQLKTKKVPDGAGGVSRVLCSFVLLESSLLQQLLYGTWDSASQDF